jgi:hypothetical protein
MQRSRWILVTVLVLVGAVWIGQGLGLLRGSSFMVDDPLWAVAGVALIGAGLALAAATLRRRGA